MYFFVFFRGDFHDLVRNRMEKDREKNREKNREQNREQEDKDKYRYTFDPSEVAFLREYERVMAPLAIKLDLLQGDTNSYLGCLLPHITHLIQMLQDLHSGLHGGLTYTREIVKAMLDSLPREDRFGKVMFNNSYILASCFHPAYKLKWVKVMLSERYETIREQVISKVAEELKASDPCSNSDEPVTAERSRVEAVASTSSCGAPRADLNDLTNFLNAKTRETDMVDHGRKTYTDVARDLVKDWEAADCTHSLDDAAFMDNDTFIELFRRYNTGVVSSAACERFFSQGKDTLTAKRQNMEPVNFEGLMFMRGNMHIWYAQRARKRRQLCNVLPHPQLEALMDKMSL
jgi:hAT family C-terminal dimerisation region